MLEDVKSCKKPSYSGSFYPSEKFRLEKMIDEFIRQAEVSDEIRKKDITAVVSPHAGYKYSGIVAAHSYKAVQGKDYDVVIILAPSHHFYLNYFIIDDRRYYQTPLGVLSVNQEIINFLRSKNGFEISHRVQDEEHSLEVQLPFIYHIFNGKVEIVPILYGEENRSFMVRMAEVLGEMFDKFKDMKMLVVVSTDLSHYHTYDEAYIIDNRMADVIARKDFESYVSMLYSKKIEACGSGPLGTFIYLSNLKNKQVRVLKLLNSGDTSGPKDYVVGYLSAVMY